MVVLQLLYCPSLMDHAITIQLDMLGICFRKVNGNGEVTGEGRSVDPRVLQIDSMRLAVFEHARVSNICHFGTSSCHFPLLTTRYRSELLACIIFRHLMIMFGRYICAVLGHSSQRFLRWFQGNCLQIMRQRIPHRLDRSCMT